MSNRRIEHIVDEDGKEYWMEPETFDQHPLTTGSLYSLSQNESQEIEYKISYNDATSKINMHCRSKKNGAEGPDIEIETADFMKILLDSYKKQDSFSRRPEVLALKRNAEAKFIKHQLENTGDLFNSATIGEHGKAIGYVRYGKDIVGVFDTFSFTRDTDAVVLSTETMYTDITITDEKVPTVEIVLDNGRKYTSSCITDVSEVSTGIFKSYDFRVDDFISSTNCQEDYIQLLVPTDDDSTDWQDQRKNLLASDQGSSGIDDRFDSIFDF